ncbi:hypothetical protein ABIE45_006337 [Methylobacterium sp. OAE515]|uniref:hypothetical protein n=1 Tax=Methylobacterium sp. OAE515 TaxID=2817895 RepID=UPI001A03772A
MNQPSSVREDPRSVSGVLTADSVMRPLCLWQQGNEEGDLLRWDEVFLKPASRVGERAFELVRQHLEAVQPIPIALVEAGDTLVIDNWRMLHSRPPIVPGRENRELARVYLERLH